MQIYKPEDEGFIDKFSFTDADIDDAVIDCFVIDSNGNQYICTSKHGFFKVNPEGHIVQHLQVGEANSIFEDSKGNVWIATRGEGLYQIAPSGRTRHFTHNPDKPYSLGHDNVRKICEDLEGNLWISTFDGLSRLDPDTRKFIKYRYELQSTSFGLRSITSLICDKQGTLWIGSFYEGLCFYNTIYDNYRYYRPSLTTSGSLGSPIVTSVAEGNDGTLWFGTEGNGVNQLTHGTNCFKAIRKADGLSSDVVKSLYFDKEENALWIASLYDGIDRLDLSSGKIKNYGTSIDGEPETRIENIVHITQFGSSLLLATSTGIISLDKETGMLKRLQTGFSTNHRAQVWDMEIDRHSLWFTSSTDLYCFHLKDRITKCYPFQEVAFKDVNNNMNSILKDSKGRLWFGSSGSGFFLFDKATDSFRNFGSNGTLGNGYVTGIAEDRLTGMIYISTNDGIASFNPETETITQFNHFNGFPLTSVNENSLHITEKGELFSCGIDGMISIMCTDLQLHPHDYEVFISGLVVDNRQVLPTCGNILDEDILFQKEIKLGPKYSTVGFELSSNDHTIPAGMNIEYMLEGFDSGFIKAGAKDHVTYTNLNPGRYTFIVRGTLPNTDGMFPENRIALRIVPPFYKTEWFLFLVVALVLGIMLYVFNAYTTNIKLRSTLDSEKREKEYTNAMNQQKLRFFTNISHEFRTPLTLIYGQLEVLLQRNDLRPSVYSNILNIYRNAKRMRRLVDEFIDIRKQEQGYMKLRVSENNIVDFLKEIWLSFEEYAKHKGVAFSFVSDIPVIPLMFDPAQMEKVIYNLLSNAFKYTRPGNSISLSIENRDKDVVIKVTDNGSGIAPEHIQHIFERFYQDDRLNASISNQGSGVGLSLAKAIVEMHEGSIEVSSEPDKETTFTVTLIKRPVFSSRHVIVSPADNTEQKKYISDYNENSIPQPPADNSDEIGKMTMQIVEDNDEVRDMLSQIFTPIYRIIMADNGVDGIELARKENPDIILSDIMMPGMTGVDMCSRLKNDLETCHIPIVLLTARTAEEYAVEGLMTGADDYITKPFNIKLLVARCNNLVAGRKRLQQKYLKQPEASVQMLSSNPNDQELLEKAVKIVHGHMDNSEFNIEMFGKEMGLSRTYLFTKIKGLTGLSPNEFISTIRLKEAVRKLADNPKASMVDIAYSLGFSSPSYFIKCFKDMYGKTPNAYRKELLGK